MAVKRDHSKNTFLYFWRNRKKARYEYFIKIVFEVSISFMEIYNENAYDLLDKKHIELPLE